MLPFLGMAYTICKFIFMLPLLGMAYTICKFIFMLPLPGMAYTICKFILSPHIYLYPRVPLSGTAYTI